MSKNLKIVERIGNLGVELELPASWDADCVLLFGTTGNLPSMIADTTKRVCPNKERCLSGGSVVEEGGKLLMAMVTCQNETCEIGK